VQLSLRGDAGVRHVLLDPRGGIRTTGPDARNTWAHLVADIWTSPVPSQRQALQMFTAAHRATRAGSRRDATATLVSALPEGLRHPFFARDARDSARADRLAPGVDGSRQQSRANPPALPTIPEDGAEPGPR
jgi:hypothetical protein